MNYLAHAYLSFNSDEILVGNMISDFVKGKRKFSYAENIQKGIALHRFIDHFTDTNSITKEAKTVFKPVTGAYAGAFTDVAFDHFIATDKNIFSGNELKDFAARTYGTLEQYAGHTPPAFSSMLPYMVTQNWLYNYRSLDGIEKSFKGVYRRALYLGEYSVAVMESFEMNYAFLKQCYDQFFPSLYKYSKEFFEQLK